jgi:hypothetical protein
MHYSFADSLRVPTFNRSWYFLRTADSSSLYGSASIALGPKMGICSKSSRVGLLTRRVVVFSVLLLAEREGKYRASGV